MRELLPQLQRQLPGSIRLLPTFDRSQSIVNSLHDVQFTLVLAFVLVIFVICVFLGRASDTLIPMVALPMSFLITFVAMWWLGYSVNNLILMALTLAMGSSSMTPSCSWKTSSVAPKPASRSSRRR